MSIGEPTWSDRLISVASALLAAALVLSISLFPFYFSGPAFHYRSGELQFQRGTKLGPLEGGIKFCHENPFVVAGSLAFLLFSGGILIKTARRLESREDENRKAETGLE